METPNYVAIGSARGRDIKTGETVYGWHWSIIENGFKVTHYIRKEGISDISKQEDIEVDNVSFFIGYRDMNMVPLFSGDKVKFEFLGMEFEGTIVYSLEECAYVIKCKNEMFHFGKIEVYKK